MDQVKFGVFLKELRKEKGLTQEQIAQNFNISSRTVSRWETGSNMPDISILIELADFYEVDIRELIDGERRKSEAMDNNTKETILKVSEYNNTIHQIIAKRMRRLSYVGLIAVIVYVIFEFSGLSDQGCIYEKIESAALGLVLGIMIVNVLYATGILTKIKGKRLSRKFNA